MGQDRGALYLPYIYLDFRTPVPHNLSKQVDPVENLIVFLGENGENREN